MKKILFSVLGFLISSCAYMYSPVNLEEVKYVSQPDTNLKIIIQNSNDNIFEITGNKRLEKKSKRKKVRPIAIKVVNNSNIEINFDSLNIEIFSNYSKSQILSNQKVFRTLKQNSSLYSLYLLGNIISFGYSNNQISFDFLPSIFFSIISIGNITLAYISNHKFKKDIYKYSLQNKIIPANSVTTGLVFINADSINNILIRYKYEK